MKQAPQRPGLIGNTGRVPGRRLNDFQIVAGRETLEGPGERKFERERDARQNPQEPRAPAIGDGGEREFGSLGVCGSRRL
jgi:hypothetical protein